MTLKDARKIGGNMSKENKKSDDKSQMPKTIEPYKPSEDVKSANNQISAKKSRKFALQAMEVFKISE